MQIHDAKLHYHKKTDEFYYIIDGQGTMILDEDEIELHRGVVVYVQSHSQATISRTADLTRRSLSFVARAPSFVC